MIRSTDAATGVALSGLSKTYRSPEGPVHAVRGIDVAIARGRDGRAARARTAPASRRRSTCCSACSRPTPARCRSSAARPREAVAAGAVGAMLQTGALIRDLSVRELVAMMASLYPRAARRRRGARADGHRATIADRRTQKLSGGQTQRVRFAIALVSEPGAARARRADGRDGRRGPARASGRRCARSPRAARPSSSRRTTSRRPTPTPTASC